MNEAGLTDTVVQAPETISAIGTSIASSSGAAGLLWLLLRGKFVETKDTVDVCGYFGGP